MAAVVTYPSLCEAGVLSYPQPRKAEYVLNQPPFLASLRLALTLLRTLIHMHLVLPALVSPTRKLQQRDS